MENTTTHIAQSISLNPQILGRSYSADIATNIQMGNKRSYNAIGLQFYLEYKGINEMGLHIYKMCTTERHFINERYNIIKKLSKAQQIAKLAASINDNLQFLVTPHFEITQVTNTDEIRKKWQEVRAGINQDYPGLETETADFDWQIKEENIQKLFKKDNFLNAFFHGLYNLKFIEKDPLHFEATIMNGIGAIDIPIKKETWLAKQDLFFKKATIRNKAQLDTDNNAFPLSKLNGFFGNIPEAIGKKHQLSFKYLADYQTKPQEQLITEGVVEYSFEVTDIYKKETKITFNLDDYER